jgi:hypothetical protein
MKPADLKSQDIPKLPPGKTVVDIYADMLRYLFNCTKDFVESKSTSGRDKWASLVGHAEIILSHPNGWEGPQQKQMRTAAVRAGLVPDTAEGRDRIHFVTEGEASLHYCITHASPNDRIMVWSPLYTSVFWLIRQCRMGKGLSSSTPEVGLSM